MTYYPAPSPYFPIRPAGHGYIVRHIKEVKEQVYSELRAERARRSGSRTPSSAGLPHREKYATLQYTRTPKKSSLNSYVSEPLIRFPTPQIIVHEANPRTSRHASPFPRGSARRQYTGSMTQVHPLIRFPTPQLYHHDTPSPFPEYSPYNSLEAPRQVHKTQAQVMPFPDSLEATPLLPYPPPTMFDSSNESTAGSFSTRSSASSRRAFERRLRPETLLKAAEQMKICRRQTAEWIKLMKQYVCPALVELLISPSWYIRLCSSRTEKLSPEDEKLVSLVEEIHQKTSTAVKMTLSLLHTMTTASGIQRDVHLSSGKLAADLSALATLTRTIQFKLGRLSRRLREAKAIGQAKPPGFFSRMEDPTGCLAGVYLKNRLLRFTSLLKARKQEYTELDAKGTHSHIFTFPLLSSDLFVSKTVYQCRISCAHSTVRYGGHTDQYQNP